MSKTVNGFITWIRTFLDDVYALKGSSGLTIDTVYPVGSIYMSVDASKNPNSLFNGTTWVKLEGRFLLGSDSTYASGATGGSKDAVVVSHNHTQEGHSHGIPNLFSAGSGSTSLVIKSSNRKTGYTPSTDSKTPTINYSGEDGTDKNMPPYLVVNMWKRTA